MKLILPFLLLVICLSALASIFHPDLGYRWGASIALAVSAYSFGFFLADSK